MPRGAQGLAPFAVVADLGAGRVQHQAGLAVVGFGVGLDLLGRERRARAVAPRGVADQGGEVADQEDHLVPQVLQLAHLVEHHRVADVDVGRRGVQPQLDAQRLARGLGALPVSSPIRPGQQFFHAAQRDFKRPGHALGQWCVFSRLIHRVF
jgi:hypothetical protein